MDEDKKYPPAYYKYREKIKHISIYLPVDDYKALKNTVEDPKSYLKKLAYEAIGNPEKASEVVKKVIDDVKETYEQAIAELKAKIKSLQDLNSKLLEDREQ